MHERNINFIKIPYNADRLIRPQDVVIKLDRYHNTDIGIICYSSVKAPEGVSNVKCNQYIIDEKSLVPSRLIAVKKIINGVSYNKESGYWGDETIYGKIALFRRFVLWCDTNKMFSVLDDISNAKPAAQEYITFLKNEFQTNKMSLITACQKQSATLDILDCIFDTDLKRELQTLSMNNVSSITENRAPPSEDMQSLVLSTALSVFETVYEHIHDFKKFPVKINVPSVVDSRGYFYMLPVRHSWLATECNTEYLSPCIDFKTGGVKKWYEIEPGSYARESDSNLKVNIQRVQSLYDEANSNKRSHKRIRIAHFACQTFLVLFTAATAINLRQLRDLTYSDKYQVIAERQGFKGIKYRAHGKTVYFSICGLFLPLFEKYIELRKFILGKKNSKYLFPAFNTNSMDTQVYQLNTNSFTNACVKLSRLNPIIPKISPGYWRAAKSDYLLTNTDIHTAAALLQNSVKTVLKNYSLGSKTKAVSEMRTFYDNITDIITSESSNNRNDIAIGGCKQPNNPNREINNLTNEEIRCNEPEGCLFCDKYLFHPDEKDVLKLASYRFIINETSALAENEDHFKLLFGEILKRIDTLLAQVSNLSKDKSKMVASIVRSVEIEGVLDPYWEYKYEMLQEMELI